MKSTGEAMGIDRDFARAFAKSQLGAGVQLPRGGTVFISVKDPDKPAMVPLARRLVDLGFALIATGGTADFLTAAGLPATKVNKISEGRPDIVDAMKNAQVHLLFNTTEGASTISDSFRMRETALLSSIPYYTTVAGAKAAVEAIAVLSASDLEVAPLQSYFTAAS
jgi:carbamoyl-phosphate synthase large subunit